MGLLVLSRKEKEVFYIPAIDAMIAVVSIEGNVVKIGIDAPREIAILRPNVTNERPNGTASLLADNRRQHEEKHALRNTLSAARMGLEVLEKQLELGHSPEALRRTLSHLKWQFVKHDDPEDNKPELQVERPVRALLVEDQQYERGLLSNLLNLSGFEVIEAETGEQAMNYLAQTKQKPDVMLLDMGLPKMDGREVVRQVRSDPETGQMKIFVISGRDKDQGVPADQWFRKPLNPSQLLANLNALKEVG